MKDLPVRFDWSTRKLRDEGPFPAGELSLHELL